MVKFDDALLEEVGLGELPTTHRIALLRISHNELELRVGSRLAFRFTPDQLSEFEGIIDRKDKASALPFLERAIPDYRDVVADEFELLKAELSAQRQFIRALSWAYADVEVNYQPRPSPWDRSPAKT